MWISGDIISRYVSAKPAEIFIVHAWSSSHKGLGYQEGRRLIVSHQLKRNKTNIKVYGNALGQLYKGRVINLINYAAKNRLPPLWNIVLHNINLKDCLYMALYSLSWYKRCRYLDNRLMIGYGVYWFAKINAFTLKSWFAFAHRVVQYIHFYNNI